MAISGFPFIRKFIFPYPLLFLKQSMHLRLLVLRGSNGSEVMAAPQSAHFQSPVNLGFSPVLGVAPSKSAGGWGSLAGSASNGISSGGSEAVGMSGSGCGLLLPSFFFMKQARQVSPAALLG